MKTSESIDQIAAALAKAQAAFEVAGKDKTAKVPGKEGKTGYSYSYADLPAVFEACRKALGDNGIAILQPASANGSMVRVSTRLVHSSGQWLSTEDDPLVMTAGDASPQKLGSAITYARRYSLMSLVGVVADEDDDAQEAQRDWRPPPRDEVPQQQRQGNNEPRGQVQRAGGRVSEGNAKQGEAAPRQQPPANQPPASPYANLSKEELEAEIGTSNSVDDLAKIGKVVAKGHPLRGQLEARYRELTGKGKAA